MKTTALLLLGLVGCGGDAFQVGNFARENDGGSEAGDEVAVGDAAGDTGVDNDADKSDAGSDTTPQNDSGTGGQEGGQDSDQMTDSGQGQDAPSDGPCTLLDHSNGLGQTYVDCSPLGTYTATTATKACSAWLVAQPSPKSPYCVVDADCICASNSADWACWSYDGAVNPGHVGIGTFQECAFSTDPTWD